MAQVDGLPAEHNGPFFNSSLGLELKKRPLKKHLRIQV